MTRQRRLRPLDLGVDARDLAGGVRLMAWLVLGSALALGGAGVLPAVVGQAGAIYAAGMALMGAAFVVPSVAFFVSPDDLRARRLLWASIVYVPVFFVLVVADFLARA